jgi:hypothetical protein
MDPRCIGDVNPGNDRGIRRTRRGQVYDARVYRGHRHHVSRHYHARKRYALNCSLRANRANPRCMR